MIDIKGLDTEVSDAILSPVDRVSEMLFGLFMALTFVGAVSTATAGRQEIETMFIAALGCNLAWGLVDAVMYLVRTITERGRTLTLALAVQRAPDAETGRRYVASALSTVAATFPVVLPFLFLSDVATAMHVSRATALAMLFLGGAALGRYAGYGSWRMGALMMGLGTALVIAIIALGG